MKIRSSGALVTGASRGLGEALAKRLADEGARVVVNARNEKALNAVAREIRAARGEAHGSGGTGPPGPLFDQSAGGPGTRPAMISSIWCASMVSYWSRASAITCSLSMLSVSNCLLRAYARSRIPRTTASILLAVSFEMLLCWVTERPRNTSSSSSP